MSQILKSLNIRPNLAKYSIILPLLTYLYLLLHSLLNCGYFSDDAYWSLAKGIVEYKGISVIDLSLEVIKGFANEHGRFFPIWYLYAYPLFYFTSLLQYNILKISIVIIDILMFGYFIKLTTGRRGICFILMIIIPIFFQFSSQGPIVAYALLIPLIFFFILSSLILLHKYLENKDIKYLISSVILYAISLFIYEITYVMFIFHFLLILKKTRVLKTVIRYNLPFVLTAIVPITIAVILRNSMDANLHLRYSVKYDIFEYIKNLIFQISSSFPFRIIHYSINNNINTLLENIQFTDILGVIIFIYILLLFRKFKPGIRNISFLIIFGLALTIIPAVMVPLSSQIKFKPGMGYIPSFIQHFGCLMLLYGFYAAAIKIMKNSYIKSIINSLLFIILIIFVLLNTQKNRIEIEKSNMAYLYPRNILEQFIKSKDFKNTPEGSIILFDPEYSSIRLWENEYFFYIHSGKKYTVYKTEEFIKKHINNNAHPSKDVFHITYQSSGIDKGNLLMGRVATDRFNCGSSQLIIDSWEQYSVDSNNTISLLDQKDLLLTDSGDDRIYHIGFKNFINMSFRFPPLLTDNITIEIIIKPDQEQIETATIISNYTDSNNSGGFALIKTINNPNQYALVFSKDKKFIENGMVELTPNQWNYLSIVFDKKNVIIYNNGSMVSNSEITGSYNKSYMPVDIGNDFNKKHPFRGEIKEVKISNSIIKGRDIRKKWKKFQSHHPGKATGNHRI